MKQLCVLVLSLLALDVKASAELARSKNCLACHSVNKKVVGPAFKDISAKYAGTNATTLLVKKVMSGGSGAWGMVPMPPNTQVTEEEAKTLVTWILTLR